MNARTVTLAEKERGQMVETTTHAHQTPVRTHVYQNHHLDSSRWDSVALRDDDIVIATSYKAGTTWMQGIVANLIFSGQELPASLFELSPWVDARRIPLESLVNQLEQQTHRRFMKTHLALDGLRYEGRLTYVYVGRDARDVFMSFWNHYGSYTEEAYASFNGTPGRVGAELPQCPEDVHELWRNWITRGWFEWESEGYPFWSNLHHVQSWWEYRHLANILFVHYADLLADFEGETRRVADFLEIEVPEAAWPSIIRNCSLAEMRASGLRQMKLLPRSSFFRNGPDTFFYKGTNGRWRKVLTEEEIALYDQAAKRELTPDCRQWLENGRRGAVSRP
jgi:aryl sulfotransferase